MKTKWGILFLFAMVLGFAGQSQADLISIDFSAYHNKTMAQTNISDGPQGSVTLGGIPFEMSGVWHSAGLGSGTHSIDISVDIFGVDTIYSIINTWWGVTNPNIAFIEFYGTGGASYSLNLIGNNHIRDYNNDGWTNNINGTTTENVFNSIANPAHRLDMQTIDLPEIFRSETLETIRLIDSGADNWQRMFLAGLTAETNPIPEPATMFLLGTGLIGLAGFGRKIRRRRQ